MHGENDASSACTTCDMTVTVAHDRYDDVVTSRRYRQGAMSISEHAWCVGSCDRCDPQLCFVDTGDDVGCSVSIQ